MKFSSTILILAMTAVTLVRASVRDPGPAAFPADEDTGYKLPTPEPAFPASASPVDTKDSTPPPPAYTPPPPPAYTPPPPPAYTPPPPNQCCCPPPPAPPTPAASPPPVNARVDPPPPAAAPAEPDSNLTVTSIDDEASTSGASVYTAPAVTSFAITLVAGALLL